MPAAFASLDYRPLACLSDPNADWFHKSAAIRFAVAGDDIQVQAGQAVVTVISVVAARALGDVQPAADLARKAVGAGVFAVVPLVVHFAFVFSVQVNTSKKFISTLWEAVPSLKYASLPT